MQKANLSLQQWGNSLAVRIPASIARSAHFKLGQPVELSIENDSVIIKSIGVAKLSLAQKLARFDPEIHGGETMATTPIGVEKIDD